MKKIKRVILEKITNMILDIIIVIFAIFLLIFIYNNVQIKILGNNYSSFFGYTTFEVQTGSMADTINPGDWIVVKVTKDIKLDDIITYSQKGEFITHRVVETYKDSFITKGDANNSKDGVINKSQVVGKVIKILPYFGIIRKTFFNPFVLITLMLTLYSISYVLRNINNNNVKNKKHNYKDKIDSIVNNVINLLLDYINNKLKNTQEDKKSVDSIFTDEEVEYASNELEIAIPNIDAKDIDKTLYFRRIAVDKIELDNIEATEGNKKNDDELNIEDIDVENIEEEDVKEKVKLIQNKRKKFKNIVEKAIYFKKEEINKIIDVFLLEEKVKSNENSIKEVLLNAYIDGKYYNYCGNVNVEFNKKTIFSRIEQEIKKNGNDLIEKYTGSDEKYSEKVSKYVKFFMLINRLEQINTTDTKTKKKRELYKEKILKVFEEENLNSNEIKNIINKIIKIQKLYQYMINYILENAKTNTFDLNLEKISGTKDMYAVSINHNIIFSKVYSDYIVSKTYEEGTIAEDKVVVLLNLLLINIVRDMLDLEPNKKYFIQVPESIYTKPNKLDKIFKLLDDEYAKNNIIIVLDNNSIITNKEKIKELRKKGYKFALVLTSDIQLNNNDYLELVEYLFSDKNYMTYNIASNIPEDLAKKIINDDILSKLSSFGGE